MNIALELEVEIGRGGVGDSHQLDAQLLSGVDAGTGHPLGAAGLDAERLVVVSDPPLEGGQAAAGGDRAVVVDRYGLVGKRRPFDRHVPEVVAVGTEM